MEQNQLPSSRRLCHLLLMNAFPHQVQFEVCCSDATACDLYITAHFALQNCLWLLHDGDTLLQRKHITYRFIF
jgi:hypothetical protein